VNVQTRLIAELEGLVLTKRHEVRTRRGRGAGCGCIQKNVLGTYL
jgi:hypothetical protein